MSKTSDEGMARLEHKVDLILEIFMRLSNTNAMPQLGSGSHQCPICKQSVKYIIDMLDKSVARQCDCKTGLMAPLDLDKFAPPKRAGGANGQGSYGGDSAADGEREPGTERDAPRSRGR